MFRFGLEHEVALLRRDGCFVDYTNTSFSELEALIARLPLYPSDYPGLYVGDAGIRKKRWYLEGIERFDEAGTLVNFDPKGIEIRTTRHPTILGAVNELAQSYAQLTAVLDLAGFVPIAIAFHPWRTAYRYDPPLNVYERQLHEDEPEYQTEHLPMVTFGPDLNFSCSAFDQDRVIAIGRKLTYYSPAIVPFSFNAPIYAGQLWEGLSVRTAIRTGPRPAVRVYLDPQATLLASQPILTKRARHGQEVGRIEFKACDSCADWQLYAGLLALLKGLALDTSLAGYATTPDAARHQAAAQVGFNDAGLAAEAASLLEAAATALAGDPDQSLLAPLTSALARRDCPAQAMRCAVQEAGSVEAWLAAQAIRG